MTVTAAIFFILLEKLDTAKNIYKKIKKRKNITFILAWAIDLHMYKREHENKHYKRECKRNFFVISAGLKQMFVIFFMLNN